jgi:hypothetical protein
MRRPLRTLAVLALGLAVLAAPALAPTAPLQVTYYYLPG